MTPPTLEQVNTLIGMEMPALVFSYSARDTALYALGVGAPGDWLNPDELKFVYELSADFCALPTLPVIYSGRMIDAIVAGDIGGIRFNPMMLVHGEQALDLKAPIPTAGTITCTPIITAVYDKGSGMVIVTDVHCVDEHGTEIAVTQGAMFIRGLGGFGGDRGPSGDVNVPPDRAPDAVHSETTLERQALIYRLSGDINPLHADPLMAGLGNFDRPILHGLCTYGFAGRALIKHFGGNQPARLKTMRARFSKHVFPGDTLVTEMWQTGDNAVTFRVRVPNRDVVVLSSAAATFA